MKTDKELLEEMRKKAKVPGTMEHLMYSLLDSAHPTFKQHFEDQAVMMMKAANGLVKEFEKASQDPDRREQISKLLDQVAEAKKQGLSPKDATSSSGNNT